MTARRELAFESFREWVALKVAPWLYVPYREDREEAFRDLAEVAYTSRDAIWTSPRTLVKTALNVAENRGYRKAWLAHFEDIRP